MSESLKPPATAAACDEKWIADRRASIQRDGYPVRAGANNTIELKSLTPHEKLAAWDPLRLNAWCTLTLPGGVTRFATAEDRDIVLDRLVGKSTP